MVDLLLGGYQGFAVLVFVIAGFAFLGVALLISRIGEARKRRRSKLGGIGGRGTDSFDLVPAQAAAAPIVAPPEVQLRDANHALFKVLMECCQMIVQAGDAAPLANSEALSLATSLWTSRRAEMSNREIADNGYQLAAFLQSFDDARIVAIRRVLTQLALAEQWTTSWQGRNQMAGGESDASR